MVKATISEMKRLNDDYQPALIQESRRLAALSVQFKTDPASQRNQYTQSLQAFHAGWVAEADQLTRRAWGVPIQSEDGTYRLSDGECWRLIETADIEHASLLADANRIDLSPEDYLRAKDRAASLTALYQQPVEFLREYRLMDPAVKIAIQEAHGVLLPDGWSEVRHEIESDRLQRVGSDRIQAAHDQRESAYGLVESCWQQTQSLYATFGGNVGARLAMASIVEDSLVGSLVPEMIAFAGSDALYDWQRGVVREVDYNLYNGNPELRFRFRRVSWGLKRVGDRWIYTS